MKLKDLIPLKSKITVYVPATVDVNMEAFKGMDEPAVNRWCFYDLKKRGAIE